ncbi:sulfate transport system permease protein [Synechococcus elongatus PCC 6301]|uniref:Sulfate transport system permease protein CysT n=1 Tax=Synechococcus sp. (strain ATCC 27144 / PCC 6301 / SAUG 1402/1) TaxID=269084 RepID=A0A0H3K5V9_SYNP6|nr:sulfate ABC transporter permease subunit CysT [Synechococcus elongatus]BAD80593.1 sulfate transport system permease protein [Synechococcus elongatus PCC 6301]
MAKLSRWETWGSRSLRLAIALYAFGVVGFPLLALLRAAWLQPAENLRNLLTQELAIAAFQLSLTAAFGAAIFNTILGLLLAWILVRYQFPGKRLADALIDLPFALSGVVAGIALFSLYGPNGTIGQFWQPGTFLGQLLTRFGIEDFNFTASQLGVIFAMVYVTLPFVMRTVQPVLAELEPEIEEVAATLGATPSQTFWRVLFPQLIPALVTGFSLALARGLGEYGLVTIISGNLPYKTLVATVYVYQRFEEFDISGATAVSLVLLIVSLLLLAVTNSLGLWFRFSHKY